MKPTNKTIVGAILFLALSLHQSTAQTNNPSTVMPEVMVTDTAPAETRPGWLQEEEFVGPYQQPEWTTARRFSSTRVYIQKLPWEAGFEQWVRYRHHRDGTSEFRFQEEFEIGLPHRFQLDLYETWAVNQDHFTQQDEVSAEVRYALADWGKIPLNPTLYFEYAQHDHDPNTIEAKLLLGTDFSPRWHWGLNLICEQELSGGKNTELAVSQGISYTLVDEKLGVGLEWEYSHEKANGSKAEDSFVIGPSAQWRPAPWCHVDFTPMFGCTYDSPRVEAFLVIGIDFGSGSKKQDRYAPSSLKSH